MMPLTALICGRVEKLINKEDIAMSKYEADMVGNKKVSDSKSLQGAKLPKTNSSIKAHKTPYDASMGTYLKTGGPVKGRKKMAIGGAAKVRKGMMNATGKPKA